MITKFYKMTITIIKIIIIIKVKVIFNNKGKSFIK